ncbi:MAG: roadblock/LC7 domain-containing protein [Candidatus Helarchaeota archaeon]|nr:roadblock/LC7 domain-containing protein [Candidatus Helarchaeota archaeon]
MSQENWQNEVKRMQGLLKNFVTTHPGILNIAIVSEEGLPMASILEKNVDDVWYSKISAAASAMVERILLETRKGEEQYCIMQGRDGCVIIFFLKQPRANAPTPASGVLFITMAPPADAFTLLPDLFALKTKYFEI